MSARPYRSRTARRSKRSRMRCMAIRSPCSARMRPRPECWCVLSCRARSRSKCCGARTARGSAAWKRATAACFRASFPSARRTCCASPGRAACRRPRTPTRSDPLLGEIDLHLFNEGRHFKLAEALGANVTTIDGVRGTRFAVWAPNADASPSSAISTPGTAAPSDAAAPPRPASGSCSCRASAKACATSSRFSARAACCCRRRPIRSRRQTELPPATASVVASPVPFRWRDDDWMRTRAAPARARCADLDL